MQGDDVPLSGLDGRYINQSVLGTASGVATLNSSSQLTSSQLPSSTANASSVIVYVGASNGSDDTVVIQTALTAANTLAGSTGAQATIRLRTAQKYIVSVQGAELLTGTGVNYALLLPANVILDLNGAEIIWNIAYTGVGYRCMIGVADGVSNWRITGGTLNGNYAPATTEVDDHGILIGACADWDIDHNTLTNFGGKPILVRGEASIAEHWRINDNRISNSASNAIGINFVQYWEICHNIIHDGTAADTGTEWLIGNLIQDGLVAQNFVTLWGNTNFCYQNTTLARVRILNNYIQAPAGPVQDCILLASLTCSDITIQGNILDATNSTYNANCVGVSANSVTRLLIENNIMIGGTSQVGVEFLAGSGLVFDAVIAGNNFNNLANAVGGAPGGVVVSNNKSASGAVFNLGNMCTFTGNQVGDGTGAGSVEVNSDCVVTGNRVNSTSNPCIRINGNDNVVSGNVCTTSDTSGSGVIELFTSASDNAVVANTLNRTAGSAGRAIWEEGASCTNNLYANNVLLGNATVIVGTAGTIESIGSGGVVRGNTVANPVGIKVVAVPTSGTAVAAAPYDRVFYVTAGTSSCTMAIQNGPSPVIPSAAFGTVKVPAGKTATPTYTNPPAWAVEGE